MDIDDLYHRLSEQEDMIDEYETTITALKEEIRINIKIREFYEKAQNNSTVSKKD